MSPNLLVFSNARPARDEAYKTWYIDQHLGDLFRTPGITGGAFHEFVAPGDAPRWRFMGRYSLDRPFDAITDEFGRRAGTPAMPTTEEIDFSSVQFVGATPRGDRIVATEHSGPVALYIVMADPLEGQVDAYNEWYDKRHIHDILDIPGFLAGQRFDLAPSVGGQPCPWSLATIYEVDPDRIQELLAESAARRGGPKMPIPPVSKPGTYVGIFKKLA